MTVYSRNYYPYGYTRQPSGAAQFGTRFIEGLMGTLQRRQQMVEQRRTEQLNALAQTYTAGVRNPLAFSQEDLTKTTEGLNRLLGGQINIPTPDRSAALQAQEFERQQAEAMQAFRESGLEEEIRHNIASEAHQRAMEEIAREKQRDDAHNREFPGQDITEAEKQQLNALDDQVSNALRLAQLYAESDPDISKTYLDIVQQGTRARKTLAERIAARSRGEVGSPKGTPTLKPRPSHEQQLKQKRVLTADEILQGL